MRSFIVSAALLAAAASAAPAPASSYGGGQQPFKFPLANGFPNIKAPSNTLTNIETQAHGTLPNGALPTKLSANSIATFSVIAANELFEVAYFTSLIKNITHGVQGYEVPASDKDYILKSLTAIRAQEELHAIGANAILASAGGKPIAPCEYVFPVDNFQAAISLAYTFTDVVLGTLQDVQAGLIANGDGELVPLIGSIIGQEGEQNGAFRAFDEKIPSELPFLTRSAGAFAFSAINQIFIVPGSCPQSLLSSIPVFGALAVDTMNIQPKDQTLTFSFENTKGVKVKDLSLVYINQQNTPIVEKICNVKTKGKMVTFDATFPYSANLMNGLTIAAVTNSAGPFADADAVAKDTLFGPGIIEIN
ncbi:Hypothetical protein R9X50_00753000 [Acrodontium crateriforme]|uniref:Sexual development protein n=1 Tax=Acrodontium crateriforme TaxID=150365 RepID=A0AAQ3MDZ8_9PEZI|nr:Hypothetical protein R9X50_00753000 [Acrodontium crateriforme]